MLDGSVNAWLNDTVEALAIGRRLGGKVIMMGVSTGAAAVIWLATQPDAEALAAVILVSPNFAPANRSANVLLWPWGGRSPNWPSAGNGTGRPKTPGMRVIGPRAIQPPPCCP
jgi:alpha-beta hydrolase superfamily lysophospholipase